MKAHNESSLVESENELSRILDTDKLNDIQHSDRLRGFYKKLVQTDAAIRNLRKNLNENPYSINNFDVSSNFDLTSYFDINNYDINSNVDSKNKIDLENIDLERLKRSINFKPGRILNFKRHEPTTQSKIDNGKLVTKTTIYMTGDKKANNKYNKKFRNKRFENFTEAGFIIEKDKVMIQYKPTRIVAKCSHSPKDSKSHEKDLAHPFYKNTQRLDQLLDQFIDRKLPDLLADRVELGVLFGNNKNKKCKHPAKEAVILVRDEDMMKDYEQNSKTENKQKDTDANDYQNQNRNDNVSTGKEMNKEIQTTVKFFAATKEASKMGIKNSKHLGNDFENDFSQNSNKADAKNIRSTTGGYDVILSISTLLNPTAKKTASKTAAEFTERPNLRKLLQANMKAEDGVAYEDLKEVLADYKEGNDDEMRENENDRKKRNNNVQYDTQVKVDETKYTPLGGVHNPNWKGPMPLYPDELTQVTNKRQESHNKVEIPVQTRDSASETDEIEPIRTDMQYIEDYLDNGYEKLAELAQAYSDYGVLSEKKTPAEKKGIDKEHSLENRKAGISVKGMKYKLKRGFKNKHLFEKLKQGRELSEGIRIEFQPTPKKYEGEVDDVGVKFREILNKHVKISGENGQTESEYVLPELTTRLRVNELNPSPVNKAKADKRFDSNKFVFKKRTLKTLDEVYNFPETILSNDYANKNGSDPPANLSKEIDKKRCNNNTVNVLESEETLNGSIQAKTNKSNEAENESSLSGFFMTLAKLFNVWDAMEANEKNKSTIIPSAKNAVVKKDSNNSESLESQLYPSYDSDMIENIGHRSRVLLSAEVGNNTEIKEDHLKSEDEETITTAVSSTEPINVNSTRLVDETTESMIKNEDASNETSNRVVKRQAIDDSNLIFWNDLYDEEYGINADPVENNIRDKHSAEKSEDAVEKILKKSNSWIQDKMKKITDRLHQGNIKKTSQKEHIKYIPKHSKRNVKYNVDVSTSNDDDNTGKLDLVTLTERMKAVCKETVKAIQETKHVQVRHDNKEGQAAASLMQQLVRLMTDLVDFQVQERTCRKLPPDLQQFLEWLTSSKEDDVESANFKDKIDQMDNFAVDFTKKMDKPTEQDLLQPSETENTDSKTDCLGTLHAVQNLIREYETMTEDDKSVMTGVKDYLENQMHFLQRQLSSFDDTKYFNRGTRFRRDLVKDLGHTAKDTLDEASQQLEKQYKQLKKMFNRYKGKVEPVYKGALKTTSEIGKAVTDIAHDLFDPDVGSKQKAKAMQKHQKVLKVKERTKEQIQKEKSKLKKEKTNKSKLKKRKHQKMNKLTSNNKAENAEFNDDLNYLRHLESLDFTKNVDQAYSDKNDRNVKNVYFETMDDKKPLLLKGSRKRDSDTFDKTDIYRIDD